MDYLRDLAARHNYRVPDFSRLWNGPDEPDNRSPEPSLAIKLEYLLLRFQEVALWTDRGASVSALIALHCFTAYLLFTPNTFLNLVAWVSIFAFLYTTWVRVWPEIRVPMTEEEKERAQAPFTVLSPLVYSGPEVEAFVNKARSSGEKTLDYLAGMRRRTPGKFCALACLTCALIGYLGSFFATFTLVYLFCLGSITIPGLLRVASENPEVMARYHEVKARIEPFLEMAGLNPPEESEPEPEPVVEEKPSLLTSIKNQVNKVKEVFEDRVDGDQVTDDLIPDEDEETKKILDKADGVRRRVRSAVPDSSDEIDGEMQITMKSAQYLSSAPEPSENTADESSEEENENEIEEAPFVRGLGAIPDHEDQGLESTNPIGEEKLEEEEFLPTKNPILSSEEILQPQSISAQALSTESDVEQRSSSPSPQMPGEDSSSSSEDSGDENPPSQAQARIRDSSLESVDLEDSNPQSQSCNPISPANPGTVLTETQTVMLKAAMREDSQSSNESEAELTKARIEESESEDFELITEEELKKADQELLNL